MTKQLSKEQAIKFYESEVWKDMTLDQIAEFQLFQSKLCVPFRVFHEAMEKALNRPVFTHEFAYWDELKKEFLGDKEAPSLEDIINLIPEEKRLILSL